jgi:hypothetical protein
MLLISARQFLGRHIFLQRTVFSVLGELIMCYARIDCSRNEGNAFSYFLVFIKDQKTEDFERINRVADLTAFIGDHFNA